MKNTSIIQKLLPSVINIILTFFWSLPFLLIFGFSTEWRVSWVVIFFIYNLLTELIYNRDFGMMIAKTIYNKPRIWWQKLIYVTLYTASFSTLLYSIWFPFDLLLINLVLLQLPLILLTDTTLHGFLSGKIKTVKIT